MRRSRFADLATVCLAGIVWSDLYAAAPGPFQIDGDALLFSNSENVTEDGSQLIYPTYCVDPAATGRQGVLTGSFAALWRTIYFNPSSQQFAVQAGAPVPFPDPSILGEMQGRPLLLTPTDASGALKIFSENFVGTLGVNTVAVFDLATGAIERIALTLPGMPIAARDLDGDGIPEIILLDDSALQLSVMDSQLTKQFFQTPITFNVSKAFAIGKFDHIGQTEIITSAGLVYALSITGLTPVGSIPAEVNGEQISFLVAADVDGDGLDEIIAIYDTTIRVYDFDTQTVKWETTPSINPAAQLVALNAMDLDGDGKLEILVGQRGETGAPGYIFVYDGATGNQLQAIQHAEFGLYGLNACDIEGTHKLDIVVGTDSVDSGPANFEIYEYPSGTLKAQSIEEAGPVRGMIVADVEGTGQPELVYTPDGVVGVGDLSLHARDAATFAPLWDTPSPFLTVTGTGELGVLAAGNVMGTGHTDLVAGSTQNGSGIIWIVDGPSHTLVQTIQLDANDVVEALAIANVDGTGQLRIVAGIAGTAGPRIEVIDGVTATRLWHTAIGTELLDIHKVEVSDLNHDGYDDLIVHIFDDYAGGPQIYVVDGASHATRAVKATDVQAFDLVDVDGDGTPEVILGHNDGSVEVMDAISGVSRSHYPACSGNAIGAIAQDNLSTANQGDVLYTCGNQLGWMSLISGQTQFMSPTLGLQPGWNGTLLSLGTSPATDRIIVSMGDGVMHLAPVSYLPPYVLPINPASTNAYGAHWTTPFVGSIDFGTYDGTGATLELVTPPSHGSVTVTSAGVFTYTASGPIIAVDFFTVRARTANTTSEPASIGVVLRNQPPVMLNPTGSLTVAPGATAAISVLAQDADIDPVTYQFVQLPTKGSAKFNGNDAVYTANAGASGQDTFSVRAFDGLQYSGLMTVTVTITAASPPPPPPPPASSSSSGGGGGTLDFSILGGLLALLILRICHHNSTRAPYLWKARCDG